MKAVLIAGVCGAVAFAGLFFFMQQKTPPAKTDSLPIVTELPTSKKAPADDEAETPKPKPKQESSSKESNSQAKKGRSNFPTIGDAPPAKPPQPPKGLYYTVELTSRRGPIPSRVIIHNTKFGKLTIVVIGAEDASGELFVRNGTYDSGGEKHAWQIRVVEGVLTVYWDGQDVPSAQSSF